MNLNNQNTPCTTTKCLKPVDCPGLMSDGRYMRSWEPRKDFNRKLMNKLNVFDEHRVREILISKGPEFIISLNTDKYICNSTNFIDPNTIDAYFDKAFLLELNKI